MRPARKPSPVATVSSGRLLIAAIIVAATCAAWSSASFFIPIPGTADPSDLFYSRAIFKLSALVIGVFLAAFTILPDISAALAPIRQRWRPAYTVCALSAACLFLWIFIIHFGRWQFGGFDYSNLIEEGWRLVQGQRTYVDFAASTPPAFNLGIGYAFKLFGVSWDATLYLTAIFACLTFLWIYWLMTRLTISRLASFLMAFAIEAAAMLTLCFWWYNNITLILAAVAFLSSFLYAQHADDLPAQASYCISLALLSLTKPNIAGLTLIASVAVVLIVSSRRLRVLLLTFAAAGLALAFLALNHISIPAMLASYRAAAAERGMGLIGYFQLSEYDQYATLGWIPALALPLYALIPRIRTQLAQRNWKGATLSLYLLAALAITCYGIATNGELREVECTLLFSAGAITVFAIKLNRPIVRRLYIALVLASIASDLYSGAQRLRVFSVGTHKFFEWQNNQNRIETGFLKNMRVSSTLVETEREVQLAASQNPGPYFLGPRIDFNYAVLSLPSPIHSPAWWHPGTAFARADAPRLIQVWQSHHFQTLIFLKDDYLYYTPQFLDAIQQDYTPDNRYPALTIYHRRTP